MKSAAKNKQRNIKLVIEYDGTNYCGWQTQKNQPSIQETITKALSKITGQEITLYGAGRTDSGVHATGQVANFFTTATLTPFQFLRAINSSLPDDIVIRSVKEVPSSFNARVNARSKVYRYTLLKSSIPSALNRNYSYFVPYKLSLERMKKCVGYLIGRHNFRAFATKSSNKEDCYRTIYSIKITRKGDYIYIDVRGNGFLYNMVRTIVGTILLAGYGKIKPADIKGIIKSADRNKAGPPAPPQGLCLMKLNY
ncbi:MAG: tRNA pseudouridine(38-40) synthase TruA [Planctomycetota bacterium]|nr:tRNA pseudouridine(38-40) synthase TruA [Planctomycetota bacterium]MDI6787786.1 tRNA pseudouridine(38-40) synthase TruA [Planctomycetota bacterium]